MSTPELRARLEAAQRFSKKRMSELEAVTRTTNTLLKKLPRTITQITEFLTLSGDGSVDDIDDIVDKQEETVELDDEDTTFSRLPCEAADLLNQYTEWEEAEDFDEVLALQSVQSLPGDGNTGDYKAFYDNLRYYARAENIPEMFNMRLHGESSVSHPPPFQTEPGDEHSNWEPSLHIVKENNEDEATIEKWAEMNTESTESPPCTFGDVHREHLKTILMVIDSWENRVVPKNKPEKMVHPIGNNILSIKAINSVPYAQSCIYAWCNEYYTPVPPACHPHTKSLYDIMFLWVFHFPPFCCLQFLLLLMAGSAGHFQAYVFAWFQHVADYLVQFNICPTGSQNFIGSIAFFDWIPIPGPNNEHCGHVKVHHKAVFLFLSCETLMLILEWCPNIRTIRSHGKLPGYYHMNNILQVITEVVRRTGNGAYLYLLSEFRRDTHPQHLMMGWRQTVKMATKKRNLLHQAQDMWIWHRRFLDLQQTDLKILECVILPKLTDAVANGVYGFSNKRHYHYLGKKRGGGRLGASTRVKGSKKTTGHAILFRTKMSDISPRETMAITKSEKFKAKVTDQHVLFKGPNQALYSWTMVHSNTNAVILHLKGAFVNAVQDDQRRNFVLELDNLRRNNIFATIVVKKVEKTVSSVELEPIPDEALENKVYKSISKMCHEEGCTSTTRDQPGNYCFGHQGETKENVLEEYIRRVFESGKARGNVVRFAPEKLVHQGFDVFDWKDKDKENHCTEQVVNDIVEEWNRAEHSVKATAALDEIKKKMLAGYKFVKISTKGSKSLGGDGVVAHEYTDADEVFTIVRREIKRQTNRASHRRTSKSR